MNNDTSYFLFQIISFKKYFYVSLGNNFFTVFVEAPLVVEALGNCPVCPPLNPALKNIQLSLEQIRETVVGSFSKKTKLT